MRERARKRDGDINSREIEKDFIVNFAFESLSLPFDRADDVGLTEYGNGKVSTKPVFRLA